MGSRRRTKGRCYVRGAVEPMVLVEKRSEKGSFHLKMNTRFTCVRCILVQRM